MTTTAHPNPLANMTLAAYRALLEALLERGYRARPFDQAEPSRTDLVLRHDLDMSLDAALPTARIEQELGLVATYFILIRTEMYNPFSQRGLAAIKGLTEMGHEVGLHLDASLYDKDLDAGADRECIILEAVTGQPVRFISFHRPGEGLLGLPRQVASRDHAYQPRYFLEMGYSSDSRGGWHQQ